MDDEVRRARDEAVNMVALRPEVGSADLRRLPRELVWHDLRLELASAVLDLLVAVAVVAVGPDTWWTTAAGIGLAMKGAHAIMDGLREARQRRREAARLRVHGPDEADTLAVLQAGKPPPRWTVVVWALYEVVLTALASAVFQAWDNGPGTQVVAVAALIARLLAAVLVARYARRMRRWKQRLIGHERIVLPRLPDRWRVLVNR